MLFLRLHHHEVVAAEILWGLWLFPLAMLGYRSRFLPRYLGGLADHQRLRLSDHELYGLTVTAIRESGL